MQELEVEPNDLQRRINQTIHLHHKRGVVHNRTQLIQDSIKKTFDQRTKADEIQIGNHVLKWDSRREEKGKHGKFKNLWMGPYIIDSYRGNNSFFSEEQRWNINTWRTYQWQDAQDLCFFKTNKVFLSHSLLIPFTFVLS